MRFLRSRGDRLPRLALDLREISPANPGHGPFTSCARSFFASREVQVNPLPGSVRLPLLHDPSHNLLLLRVRDLTSASLRAPKLETIAREPVSCDPAGITHRLGG